MTKRIVVWGTGFVGITRFLRAGIDVCSTPMTPWTAKATTTTRWATASHPNSRRCSRTATFWCSLGAVPMIAHAAGIMLDEITTTYEKWVTPTERKTAKGVIAPGNVAAMCFTINGVYRGETRIQLEHVNRIGHDAAPEWPSGNQDDVYRVDIEGTPSIFQETAFRFTDGSGRDAAAAGCLATGCGR